MIRLVVLIVCVVLGALAALFLEMSWGTVTLWVPPYRIDLSIQIMVLALILFAIAVIVAYRILAGILGIPERVRRYRQRQRQSQRLDALTSLMIDFLEGRYARAAKTSQALAKQEDLEQEVPAAVALALAIGASAAHEMRNTESRDQALALLRDHQARFRSGDQTLAALLEADFAVEDRQGARALSALTPLTRGDRRHVQTQRLALRANQLEGNWDEVLRITKLLENRRAMGPLFAARVKQQVAQAWVEAGQHAQAITLIEATVNQQWDPGLVMLYGRCLGNPKDQLVRLEQWLQREPRDAELNWALGRVCQRLQLWGKARMHLEASLRIKPLVATHLALAEIAERLSENETAALHWKAAAQLTKA